jgi:hypothetical protein
MTMAKSKKQARKRIPIKSIIAAITAAIIAILSGIIININIENGKTNATITYSPQELPAYLVDDQGEVIETTEYDGEEIPTVEEVDGGMFEDENTGYSVTDGEYEDLGWSETYDVSSPEAFRNDTLGKCIIANNKYGAQCVSLARVFWWSYANRDVSTCGTGMAKGMMNCTEQNAGDDFLVFWGSNGIQAGDWLIFDGGQFGHVGMALGEVVNGYVALLGENQGGHKCEGYGGSATNIINISIKNLIGYYRPKAYIKPVPTPTPTPSSDIEYTYSKGDFFSKVLVKLGLDEGKLWGKDGTVKFYTKQLVEQNVLDRKGNVKIGIPFKLEKR